MSITLNKDAYKQLIQQDLDFLNKHCPDTPELDHIKLLVCKSIDDLYPEKEIKICESHSECCFAQDDLEPGEYCLPCKGCFS